MRLIVLISLACFILPACGFRNGEGRQSKISKRHEAEVLRDTHHTRTIRITTEPMDGPELDGEGTKLVAGGVNANAPAGHKMDVTVTEESGDRQESTTLDAEDVSTLLKSAAKVPVVVYLIGFAFVAAGALVAFWLGRPLYGLGLAGAGILGVGTVVAFTSYPWVALVLLGLVALGCAFLVYELWERNQQKKALQGIVGGIEGLPAKRKVEVTKAIAENGARTEKDKRAVKRVVTNTKREVGRG